MASEILACPTCQKPLEIPAIGSRQQLGTQPPLVSQPTIPSSQINLTKPGQAKETGWMLLAFITLPATIMSGIGSLAVAIWLLVLGQWRIIVGTCVLAFVVKCLIFIPAGPRAICSNVARALSMRGKTASAIVMSMVGHTYLFAILTIWAIIVFTHIPGYADPSCRTAMLFWVFPVANFPMSEILRIDKENNANLIVAATLLLSSMTCILWTVFGSPDAMRLLTCAVTLNLLGLVAVTIYSASHINRQPLIPTHEIPNALRQTSSPY